MYLHGLLQKQHRSDRAHCCTAHNYKPFCSRTMPRPPALYQAAHIRLACFNHAPFPLPSRPMPHAPHSGTVSTTCCSAAAARPQSLFDACANPYSAGPCPASTCTVQSCTTLCTWSAACASPKLVPLPCWPLQSYSNPFDVHSRPVQRVAYASYNKIDLLFLQAGA